MSESGDGDIYAKIQHPPRMVVLFSCPYLLIPIDHELYDPLNSLVFRAHILASPNWRDGIGKRSWLVRIRKKAILDCIFPFLFSVLLELWARREAKSHYVCLRVSSCRARYVPFDKGRSCAACRSDYLPRPGCASPRPTHLMFYLRDSGTPRKGGTGSSLICCAVDSDWEEV